ncbi:hypothetical protein AC1031_017244 [Aphanomyces cochlioides]|nr:hypothetical protein AC1031_017244 [Aphanomyces cochlioides]
MAQLGKRLAAGIGLLAASVGGTVATIELCIYYNEESYKEEFHRWETTLLPLKVDALEKLAATDSSAGDKIARLEQVVQHVDGVEAQWRRQQGDVLAMKRSWNETKDSLLLMFDASENRNQEA